MGEYGLLDSACVGPCEFVPLQRCSLILNPMANLYACTIDIPLAVVCFSFWVIYNLRLHSVRGTFLHVFPLCVGKMYEFEKQIVLLTIY